MRNYLLMYEKIRKKELKDAKKHVKQATIIQSVNTMNVSLVMHLRFSFLSYYYIMKSLAHAIRKLGTSHRCHLLKCRKKKNNVKTIIILTSIFLIHVIH